MSDHWIRFIPVDPTFIPSQEQGLRATELLRQFAPQADEVLVEQSDGVRFVDCGENWEGVSCPRCQADLEEWWSEAMSTAFANSFSDLAVRTPCCKTHTSLSDLVYKWPVGFSRWSIEARNANIGGNIRSDQHSELESAVGCQLKVIHSMY